MVDQDTVRKFYRDTPAVRLFRWFNLDVVRRLHHQDAFAEEGHFICDLSHISVPDNPNYRHVARLPLDENGHYVDTKGLTPEERKRLRYTPCYAHILLRLWPAPLERMRQWIERFRANKTRPPP